MDPLAKILELAGITPNEKPECFLFIIGDHGVGKSKIVSAFSEKKDKDVVKPGRSTFGYEYSVINYQSRIIVNIIEVNETADNLVLKDLLTQNIDRSCVIVVHDISNTNKIAISREVLIEPLLNGTLEQFADSNKQKQLLEYYSTIASTEPIAVAPGSITRNTYCPMIIVGSNEDILSEADDNRFDGTIYYLRKLALPYGAGVSLSMSKNLLPMAVCCAMRESLPENMRENINERADYFIPPAWDSKEKIDAIVPATETLETSQMASMHPEKAVRSWQEFLSELEKEHREPAPVSSPKPSTSTGGGMPLTRNISSPEDDFLSQFE